MEPNVFTVASDVERVLSKIEFAATLRRLAESIEQSVPFEIEVDGERIQPPIDAEFSIEYERSDAEDELEFQLKWTRLTPSDSDEKSEVEEAANALP